jgi:hypothetical protein
MLIQSTGCKSIFVKRSIYIEKGVFCHWKKADKISIENDTVRKVFQINEKSHACTYCVYSTSDIINISQNTPMSFFIKLILPTRTSVISY